MQTKSDPIADFSIFQINHRSSRTWTWQLQFPARSGAAVGRELETTQTNSFTSSRSRTPPSYTHRPLSVQLGGRGRAALCPLAQRRAVTRGHLQAIRTQTSGSSSNTCWPHYTLQGYFHNFTSPNKQSGSPCLSEELHKQVERIAVLFPLPVLMDFL